MSVNSRFFTAFCISVLLLASPRLRAQENVGIGTSSPDSSAVLELSTQLLSSPKGFLVPRLTTARRDSITLPAKGLLIYNTTTNQFEYNSGTAASPTWLAVLNNGGSTGTVTSVGLSLPSIFSVSGSPVTTSGTLTATLASQLQNLVFASPDGSSGAPSFRALASGDIPSLDASKIASGTLPVSRGGTGVGTVTGILAGNGTASFVGRTLTGTTNQITITNGDGTAGNPTFAIATNPVLPGNASSSGTFTAGTGLTVTTGGATISAGGLTVTGANVLLQSGATASEVRLFEPSGSGTEYTAFKAQAQGANITYTLPATQGANTFLNNDGNGNLTWTSAGAGSVTSVGLSLPSIFTVSGSPVTTSGTLTATLASQTANLVFASPNGASGAPSFRALAAADIPSLDAAKITTGTLPIAQGGTNSTATPTAGGVAYGTGTAFAFTTAGTSGQVLVSNGASAPTFQSLATSNITSGTLPIARGGTNSSTALNNNRIMVSSGGAIVEAAALTNGQLLIGSTGAAPVAANITGTANQISVTNGAGTIGLSIPTNPVLPGNASSSGTFTAATGLTVTSGGATITAGGLTVTAGTTTLTPLSTGIVHSSAAGVLSSSPVVLTSATEVSGVLPVANGGTNSSTALNNNRIMVSNSGAVREAAALTNGQLLIGSTGAAPVAANITGTTNQLDVTNGAGTIGLKVSDNIVLPGTGGAVMPTGTTAQRPASPTNGTMRYNTTTGKFEFYQNSEWVNPLGSTLAGSGTTNYVPKFTGSTNLGNSNIFDDGNGVGIGTATPNSLALLDVSSTTKAFMPPRMNQTQRNAIGASTSTPGLMVYKTDTVTTNGVTELPGMYYWDGYSWTRMVGAGAPGSLQVFNKTTNTSSTNINTTIVDSNLRVPVAANETWAVDGVLHFTNTSNNGRVDIGFTIPASSTMKVGFHVNENGNMEAGIVTVSGSWSRFDIAGGSIAVVLFKAVITTSSTTGNFQLQWRGDNGMRLESNSFLTATKR